MRIRDYIPAVAVVVLIFGGLCLWIYHIANPIPPGERAFMPEWKCTSPSEGEVCERIGPTLSPPPK